MRRPRTLEKHEQGLIKADLDKSRRVHHKSSTLQAIRVYMNINHYSHYQQYMDSTHQHEQAHGTGEEQNTSPVMPKPSPIISKPSPINKNSRRSIRNLRNGKIRISPFLIFIGSDTSLQARDREDTMLSCDK